MSFPQVPDYLIGSIFELTPERLAARGVSLVLADLDNTLARYREKLPSPAVIAWKEQLEQAGIGVFIISNGRKPNRSRRFAEGLGVDFIHHSGKPRPTAFYQALERTGKSREACIMVGDQIFTDIWGAHNAGITAVLTHPVALDNGFRKLRHQIETPFRDRCPNKEGF